jgi:two-component system, chemotaxis family, sensor kinase CheA
VAAKDTSILAPEMQEFLKDFIEEAEELLESLDQDCVDLESNPKDIELINNIFRSVHTLKATAGFIGLDRAKDLMQVLEKLLEQIRSGKKSVTQDVMNIIFESMTKMRQFVKDVSKGITPDIDVDALIQKMDDTLDISSSNNGEPGDSKTSDHLKTKSAMAEEMGLSQTIRIDAHKLDELMNLIGELITGRNQLLSISNTLNSQKLEITYSYLDKIINQLQSEMLDLRMIPIRRIFSRFPRLVRDVSLQLAKKVTLKITGEGTGIDKTIMDKLYDPLVHVIRNAISHGIESPEERLKLNKPDTGTINVQARHEQDVVVIEVTDDGRGLDLDTIKSVALEKKFISEEDAKSMTDQEIMNLIFLPGFTIVKEAGEISGRGVGMDVLKSNLDRLNGAVKIDSQLGKGTQIRMEVPTSLIIQPVMEVKLGERLYALPLGSVVEVLTVKSSEIQGVGHQATIPYRSERIPLVRLELLFRLPLKEAPAEISMVVLKSVDEEIAVSVDQVLGREEVVIKPLGTYLGEIDGVAGMTVLGSGEIVVILDVPTLFLFAKRVYNRRTAKPLTV